MDDCGSSYTSSILVGQPNLKNNMNNQRNILYNVKWQKLRVSLLGKFVSEKGMQKNLLKLNEYLNETSDSSEKICRLYRVINLLNGTRMGFSGMGLYNTPQDKKLVAYREILQKEYTELKNNGVKFKEHNWCETYKDLVKLFENDPKAFKIIKDNLEFRKNMTLKKRQDLATRPELQLFLNQMTIIEA